MTKSSLALRFHLEDTTFKSRLGHCRPDFQVFTTTDICQYPQNPQNPFQEVPSISSTFGPGLNGAT